MWFASLSYQYRGKCFRISKVDRIWANIRWRIVHSTEESWKIFWGHLHVLYQSDYLGNQISTHEWHHLQVILSARFPISKISLSEHSKPKLNFKDSSLYVTSYLHNPNIKPANIVNINNKIFKNHKFWPNFLVNKRDLKPENLIIDRFGNVKLADFGFAKIIKKDRTYTLCGTPEYLAPEIIKGQRRGYCRGVDWWAIGILIYEMLVGFPPFYDKQPMGIYKKVICGILEMPPFLTPEAKDIIRKLLNPDVTRRLGVKDNGKSIIKHPFFEGVDMEDILMGRIAPPWVPPLRSQKDRTFFEKEQDSQTESEFYDSFMHSKRGSVDWSRRQPSDDWEESEPAVDPRLFQDF